MFGQKRKAEEKQEKSREVERQLVKMLWPVLGPTHSPHLAWQIVLARRWQVEMAIRFNRCELDFESPSIIS